MPPVLRLHVQIDQPNNPPPPGGPPDFVQGGSVRPGELCYGQIETYQEDGTPEPHVPCVGWLLDAAGRRITPGTACRTNVTGLVEVACRIPARGAPDVSFEPQSEHMRRDQLCMFTFMGMRLAVPYRSDAITIPVFLG